MKTTLLILVVTPHTHCRTKYARLIPFPAFPHLDLLEGTPWGILPHLDVLEHINMEFQQAVAAGGGGSAGAILDSITAEQKQALNIGGGLLEQMLVEPWRTVRPPGTRMPRHQNVRRPLSHGPACPCNTFSSDRTYL